MYMYMKIRSKKGYTECTVHVHVHVQYNCISVYNVLYRDIVYTFVYMYMYILYNYTQHAYEQPACTIHVYVKYMYNKLCKHCLWDLNFKQRKPLISFRQSP